MTPPVVEHADERYVGHTTAASAVLRTLGLSAIALIWLFGGGASDPVEPPRQVLANIRAAPGLSLALYCVVFALLLDFLQYVWGSMAWGVLHWSLDQLFAEGLDANQLSWRGRLAWRLAWLFRFKAKVDYVLVWSQPGYTGRPLPWNQSRRLAQDQLSAYLATGNDPQQLLEKWSPTFINLTSGILFFGKIVFMILGYVGLLRFVLG